MVAGEARVATAVAAVLEAAEEAEPEAAEEAEPEAAVAGVEAEVALMAAVTAVRKFAFNKKARTQDSCGLFYSNGDFRAHSNFNLSM